VIPKYIIHESQLLSSVRLFAIYTKASQITIEAHENYQKRSARNRYTIITSQGLLSLSVPLTKGKNQQMPIREVTISYDENWTKNHISAVRSAYGKSAFFEFYFDEYASILQQEFKYLFDLNEAFLHFALRKIKLSIQPTHTQSYEHIVQDYCDLRSKNTDTLKIEDIKYTQVWVEKFAFCPNVSILDLLFCEGPQSGAILQKMATNL
jgi:hypothetical protein